MVLAHVIDRENAFIDELLPRTHTLTRTTAAGREKAMAANVDSVVVVAAMRTPDLRLGIVDRILAFAELHALRSILVLTKTDLAPAQECDAVLALYRSLGIEALAAAPKFGTGVDAVREALRGKHALLVGQSGVGKSSLFRALGGEATVGAVNSKTGKGRQTTTSARLYRTAEGGFLIDSPGVREFALGPRSATEVAAAFVDMRSFARGCHFADCTHRHEPGCAIRAAVADRGIAQSRYQSYCSILDRAEEDVR